MNVKVNRRKQLFIESKDDKYKYICWCSDKREPAKERRKSEQVSETPKELLEKIL